MAVVWVSLSWYLTPDISLYITGSRNVEGLQGSSTVGGGGLSGFFGWVAAKEFTFGSFPVPVTVFKGGFIKGSS